MSLVDFYTYDLISCEPLLYPDITNVCTQGAPSPFDNMVVYTNGLNGVQKYEVSFVGLNTALCSGVFPQFNLSTLDSCADPNANKIYQVHLCNAPKNVRYVLADAAHPVGTVLKFVGENDFWVINAIIAWHNEVVTIEYDFTSCAEAALFMSETGNEYEERTIGYAVKIRLPQDEPPNRGFDECCYQNLVFGDLGDTNPYHNDFTSVFYKRQTPADTVTYQLIGVSTGTTALVDGVHGTLYAFGGTEQPDLSYFRVEWRDVLNALGEDIYKIRMVLSIAGVAFDIDTFSYDLRQWNVDLANGTVRIDSKQNGKLVKINTDFKNTNYQNSLRFRGFFGNPTSNFEQDNVVFSEKNGYQYFDDQITMSNAYDYVFKAYNVPECLARVLYNELIWGNELFISDYNKNNHSYLYELQPVIFSEDNNPTYRSQSRLIDINMVFSDRTKDKRKTNC